MKHVRQRIFISQRIIAGCSPGRMGDGQGIARGPLEEKMKTIGRRLVSV
jgi:hypothetical protein